MSEPKLRVRNLRKSYGPVAALRETSLEIAAGEFLTLLGPSGSGKTTLLMILAGLVVPDGGDIWIDGRLSTHEPTFRRDIGMVFQSYALFPHLTIFENIAFPLRMRRTPEAEIARKVREILEVVRLPHVAERLPRELSGGQQQRVALARCTVYKPSIVLMDEPLGALDKKLRDQMQLEIKRLHTELGVTVLYVTHDQEEAMALSDRICLMNDGRIEQIGTPDSLYFQPSSVFAADFLGGSNIFPARVVERAEDRIVLRGPSGSMLRADVNGRQPHGCDDDVACMVRPENIRLLRDGEAAQNAVDAVLEQSIMVGPVTRHHCRLSDGTPVAAMQLTAGPRTRVAQGSRVRLGWSADQMVVLPRSGNAR